MTEPPPTPAETWITESDWLLDCECETPKVLLSLFQSLSDSKQHTTFFCSPSAGLTIHTHPNPQFQCTLELPLGLFSKFHAKECDFCVSYKTLLECLGVLTIEHPLKLSLQYHAPTEVLKLEATLKHGVSSAAISGMVPPESSAELSAAFGASPVVARLLCNSKNLQDWAELELVQGVASIRLVFQPHTFTCFVVGHSSQCQVVLPLPVETQDKFQYSYPFQGWKRAMKPLDVAKETCLSINANGVLAVQHQMVHDDIAAFCDCLLLPLVEEEEADEEGASMEENRSQATSRSASMSASASASIPTTIRRPTTTMTPTSHDDTSTIVSVATQRYPQHVPQPLPQQQQQPLPQDNESETDDEPEILPRRPLLFGTASSLSHLSPATTSSNRPRRSRKRPSRPSQPLHNDEQQETSLQRRRTTSDTSTSQESHTHSRPDSPQHESSEILYCSSPEVVYGGD